MSLPKRVLFYGLLAALTLLAVEGMARLAYLAAFGEWYDRGGLGAADLAASPGGEPAEAATPLMILHPWYSDASHNLNLMSSPPPPQADTVTIGLLGGSVADENGEYLLRALSRYFSANNLPRRPVLLNLSNPGGKQPQQVNTAAQHIIMGGHFDIIINLDGYNETRHSNENEQRGIFPYFPLWTWSALVRNSTDVVETLVGRIALLRAEQDARQQAAVTHPLRHTAVYGIIHRYREQRTERRISQLNHDLAATQSAYSLEEHGPRPALRSEDELREQDARVWYRSSLLLGELAELAGAEYYHFLQPNQYIPGAKPLTDQELACCWQPDSWAGRAYPAVHPQLAQLGAKLRQGSIHFFDLTLIFKDNRETLYRDDCCHLTPRGKELLAAAMVERMGPGLRRAATAARPALALDEAARPQSEPLLVIDADFQVYRRGRHWLVYGKDACTAEDRAARFFLHIVPVDPADLPADRREYGFDNRDFQFGRSNGGGIKGRCVMERRLPSYAIAAIRTGQYVAGGDTLWSAEYRFEE